MALDVVVIGQGATGSAALYHLARRGARVAGIERFEPGHDRGSSHGRTRIIRVGYFEHPSYVPLVRRAYGMWRDLEDASGQSLLHVTGIAEIGPPGGILVRGTLASSRLNDLPHQVLEARELIRRYPAFRVPDDFVAVMQPEGGYLEAEPALRAHVALAISAGAQLRAHERVLAVEPRRGGVRVHTDRGMVEAGVAVIAAGSWMNELLPDFTLPLRVTRQAVIWVEPRMPALFAPERFPVFMLEGSQGIHYGLPLHAKDGMKLAKHHHGDEPVDPESFQREVSAADEAMIRSAIAAHIPAADGKLLSAQTCLYTNTPDGDFVIDRLPGYPQIIIASPCSGHGFKFAPVLGEILADLALKGATDHDISRFRLARFA
jgi:sarcosine oxidase